MERIPRAYQRLFAELKRRRVFSSAAIYGGAAFVIFGAADFMVPALRLPDSVATAIALVAICGFPIAMALAWFFNLTPHGFSVTDPPAEGELEAIVAQPAVRRWPSGLAAAGGIILLFGGVAWGYLSSSSPSIAFPSLAAATEGSLVVVPFSNLTADSGATFLGEGIARELAESLKRVRGLTVIDRTSRVAFVASALGGQGEERVGPGLFLEGSVGDNGEELEIALRLGGPPDKEDGDGAWTRDYRIPKEGFLAGLDQVAWDIAGELGAGDSDPVGGHLVFPGTSDFNAYCDYLQGRYLSRQGTPAALEGAIEAYHRALILDPDFSAAWSALAAAYVLLPEYGGPPIPEIAPYAQAAVNHAVAPGAQLPEAYAASGFLKWSHQWDFRGAERDFRRSIEMDPFNPISRYWLARALASQRRWAEAEEQARVALELDPHLPAAHMTLGLVLMCKGEEGAAEAFRRGLELAPEMHPAAFLLATLLALDGDLEGASTEFDRFSSLTGGDAAPFHAYLSAVADPKEAQDAVSALQGGSFFGPTEEAALLAHLGETEAALARLEEAARSRSPYFLWANALPHFSELRSDPRFQGVLAWAGY